MSVKVSCEASFGLKATLTAIFSLAMEALMLGSFIFTAHIVLTTVLVGVVLLRSMVGIFNLNEKAARY